MKLETIKLDKALHQAYFKQSLKRDDIELFKRNFKRLFERINETESEEHNKNIVSDFLKNTFYKENYEINTAGRKDLVIHKGNTSGSPVSVIIEAKSPTNKSEMISLNKPNAKALHETIHYYLNERIVNQNKEIKHLIITNIYDWFIFDATDFEKHFVQGVQTRHGVSLQNSYQEWTNKELVGIKTDWFYTEIAKPFVENEVESLPCVHINLLDYAEIVKNHNQTDDSKLINLYKILSPEHLLKLPFANDYNKIDTGFYNELLHILGLEETKKGGTKLITRVKEKDRLAGSLLENSINIFEAQKQNVRLHILKTDRFNDIDLFDVALELSITWLNRILFLKLLEAQLVKFHKNDKSYLFLNSTIISNFSELDELFFEVLALPFEKRSKPVVEKFGNLPYLNSSLFDPTDIEQKYLFISSLKHRLTLSVSKQTVLKDTQGNKLTGELNTLEYLFKFLNAYSFASDTTAEIQDDNRTIINAAVLGLIFEKLNGYKDGSFYTPSFITTYISREILKNTLVTNFRNSNLKGFKNIQGFDDLKNRIDYTDKEQRQKANDLINSLKIVDPAVGSGHFLVSVLNELVALKSELKILQDEKENRLRGIMIQNVNDELVIINEETSEPFQYYVNDKHIPPSEIQNIQQTLFNEKRTLIENCLFGVDINPKSVLICRLRMWIELLKNSFYTAESNYKYLETLPNIDINIKTGNSLISKFDTGLNIFERTAVNNLIVRYKLSTDQYKTTTDYDQKQKFRTIIENTKNELLKYAIPQDKHYKQFLKKSRELQNLIGINPQSEAIKTQIVKLSSEVAELEKKYTDNYYHVYANSLEWAIDFPEILSENGEFVGFDIVLGNPPYFSISNEPKLKEVNENYIIFKNTADIYTLFIERGMQILKPQGRLSYITSNKWLRAAYGESLREYLLKNTTIEKLIDFDGLKIFDEATVDTGIIELQKYKNGQRKIAAVQFDKTFNLKKDSIADYFQKHKIELKDLGKESWNFASENEKSLKDKMNKVGKMLEQWEVEINRGLLTGYNKAFFIDTETKESLIKTDKKNQEIISPLLRGRDVHNYFIDKKERHLINTYNGKLITEYDNYSKKYRKVRVDRIEVEKDYPSVYEYLKQFETELIKRDDQGEHWTNHRNCAYQHLFYQEKIIYPETTGRRSEFYLDTQNYIIDKTCFMITGGNLKYLLAVLNSKLIEFYFENEGRLLGQSAIQYSKQYVEKIPIPEITEANQETVNAIETLVNEIIELKETDKQADISVQTSKIDQLVYQLYELTNKEIEMIENAR